MCGLVGIFDPSQVYTKDHLDKAIDSIGYRGVDERGVEKIGPSWMAHVRLAVVDPENGHQPMTNADGSVHVIFNGEIYNHKSIRKDLEAKGYAFKSRCDTEVLIHLWREKRELLLEDLVGMFVFFIWDSATSTGILARDRQGIKPCYLSSVRGGGLAFASEIKALRCLPGIGDQIDYQALGLVHAFNYVPPPNTCFKGITHFAPGNYILFDQHGFSEPVSYWSWDLESGDEEPNFDEFDVLLGEAVTSQLDFDVDGCMFLSGGVDSSIIASHLSRRWDRQPIRAYGLTCPVLAYDEFSLATGVADQFGIDLRRVSYGPEDVVEGLRACVHHADQPHGDFSFILIRKLCEQAHKDGYIVAFNGDGPDEIMGGFSHNEAFFSHQMRSNFPLSHYFQAITYMDPSMRSYLLRGDVALGAGSAEDLFDAFLAPYRDLEPVSQIAAYELTRLMPGNNLIKGDRMGASLSIEGRSPFLDHRVTEFLSRLPVHAKLSEGVGKRFLKDYGLREFPTSHMYRKKSMPTLPIGDWIRGPLKVWAKEKLATLNPDLYDTAAVLDCLSKHVAGEKNYTRELRTLLAVSEWSSTL